MSYHTNTYNYYMSIQNKKSNFQNLWQFWDFYQAWELVRYIA